MRLSATRRQAGPLAGTLIAFLALAVVWTPSARAGCGPHGLTSRSGAYRELTRLQLLDLAAGGPDSPHEMPPRAPVPCSGAFCSGNPAAPVSADPSITV